MILANRSSPSNPSNRIVHLIGLCLGLYVKKRIPIFRIVKLDCANCERRLTTIMKLQPLQLTNESREALLKCQPRTLPSIHAGERRISIFTTTHMATLNEGSYSEEPIGSEKPIGDEGFIVGRQGLA